MPLGWYAGGLVVLPWRLVAGVLLAELVLLRRVRRLPGRRVLEAAGLLAAATAATFALRWALAPAAFFHQNGQGPYWASFALCRVHSSYGPGYAEVFGWVPAALGASPERALFLAQALAAATLPASAWVLLRALRVRPPSGLARLRRPRRGPGPGPGGPERVVLRHLRRPPLRRRRGPGGGRLGPAAPGPVARDRRRRAPGGPGGPGPPGVLDGGVGAPRRPRPGPGPLAPAPRPGGPRGGRHRGGGGGDHRARPPRGGHRRAGTPLAAPGGGTRTVLRGPVGRGVARGPVDAAAGGGDCPGWGPDSRRAPGRRPGGGDRGDDHGRSPSDRSSPRWRRPTWPCGSRCPWRSWR